LAAGYAGSGVFAKTDHGGLLQFQDVEHTKARRGRRFFRLAISIFVFFRP